jgi:hypothetical protein
VTGSFTASGTFNRTHAAYLASKVVADMYQCLAHYGKPSTTSIADYQSELVELLAGGYVEAYEFGFDRNDQRVVSWQYTVNANGALDGGDQRAGGVYARADVTGETMFNFLTYSWAWSNLTDAERAAINGRHPVNRGTGTGPTDGNGYWVHDRTYVNGGTGVTRRTFRPA